MLNLSRDSFTTGAKDKDIKKIARHRNICVVIGCLAEKMAGPNSVYLLQANNYAILDYFIANIDQQVEPSVVLFSLIALEKFAQTSKSSA